MHNFNTQKKFTNEKYSPIVILGCGLSGMLTSLSLASIGIPSIILETADCSGKKFLTDIRTTALTTASKEFLIKLDLWPVIDAIASPILDVYVVDNKSPKMLHFAQDSIDEEALGYMVKNSEFKKILLDAVQNNHLITLIDQCTNYTVDSLEANNNIYLSDGTLISCQLLILCNGRESKIHNSYFSSKLFKYYSQHAIAFNVQHQLPHEGTAVEHFLPSGPFAILPLRGGYHSSIVWTIPSTYANLLQNLEVDEFEYLIQKNFGNFLGSLKLDSVVANFPLRAYLTKKYYHNHIVLVADSAHIIHPLAGQGLNQGIKDIQALTNLIKDRDTDKQMLQTYQQLRQADNTAMYMITDNINRIFSNNISCLSVLRRTALSIADNIPLVKKSLLNYAMGKR